MAIPKETNKELVVVVENEALEVVISPPVLDAAIVVGQPPPVDHRTLLFDGFEDTSMRVRTQGGLSFEIDPVGQVPVTMVEQVLVGAQNPTGSVDGQTAGRIYIDTLNKSFFVWNNVGGLNLQVTVGTSLPGGADDGDIFIDTTTKSFWMWVT